jgi:hypothetical protein
METVAAILFAVAALGGLLLATQHFRKAPLSLPVAIVHGGVAASAVVLLLISVLRGTSVGNAQLALVLFVVAALGGLFLFSHHLRNKPLPSPVVIIHALAAVLGFLLLVLGLFAAS